MNLKSIISITGKPGLYKVVSQTKNGLIVESIVDSKRMPVYSSEKVSTLSDISIYTYESDMPLVEIFENLYKKTAGKKAISHKSSQKELSDYLESVAKDYDQDRVYHSDLKKLFQWFNILVDADLLKPDVKDDKKKEPVKKVKTPKKAAIKKPTHSKGAKKTSGAKGTPKASMPSKKGG